VTIGWVRQFADPVGFDGLADAIEAAGHRDE
jgi:hypothetical protein